MLNSIGICILLLPSRFAPEQHDFDEQTSRNISVFSPFATGERGERANLNDGNLMFAKRLLCLRAFPGFLFEARIGGITKQFMLN
jgi:hypothetical protein